MSVDLKTALETVEQLRGYERRLLTSLVARSSIRAEVSDVHELCVRELERLGMEVERVVPKVAELESHPEWCPPYPACREPDRMVSVLGSWGTGPGILLFAHIDTEDPYPRDEWETDPYRTTGMDGRIHGLGAADDKGGVVSVLAAARALLPHLQGVRLVVALVHGKLGGGLGTLPMMARVGRVECAIYCHPAETGQGMSHFKVACRGYFNFRIETSGRRPAPVEIRTPNSEDPRQGVNAFSRLQEVLDAVDRWADQDGLLCSVNRVAAGENPMVIPERAAAEGAVWFRRGTVSDVYRSLDQVALRSGARSTERFGVQSNPAEISPDHPLVAVTAEAIAAESGTVPHLYPAHVASDIRFPIRCLDAPTVGFGARAGNFYGPDEWIDAQDMHRATRVIVRIVSAWAGDTTAGQPWPRVGTL